MKKLITILTIMIVLVGAVFAANTPEAQRANGTAAIDITAKVPEAVPQFQLIITSSSDVVGEANADINLGTVNQGQVTPGEAASDEAALSLASVKALTGNGVAAADVEVAFAINQITNANLKAAYDITITATNMDIVKLSDGTEFTSASQGFDPAKHRFTVDVTQNTTMGATPTITIGSAGASSTPGLGIAVSANVLTATYDGKNQVAATKQLGTFSVKWNKNINAVAGDYKATVTMVVTNDN